MNQQILLPAILAGLVLLAGCSASPVPSGARGQGVDAAPAYFTQATSYGYRYAHNWIDRPCFVIDLPGQSWVLQSATADYVLWHKGDYALKVYLTDNRAAHLRRSCPRRACARTRRACGRCGAGKAAWAAAPASARRSPPTSVT